MDCHLLDSLRLFFIGKNNSADIKNSTGINKISPAEENGVEVLQMIDCTATMENVIQKTSQRHAASIQSISGDVKSQPKQISEQQNQIKDMTTMTTMTTISSLIKQKFKEEGYPTSTELNAPDGACPPIDLNGFNETRSTSWDDQVSLQASNLFCQRVDRHGSQRKASPDDQPKEDDRTHVSSENLDQGYWISSVDQVSSPIASAIKMFWQKPIKPDDLKAKLEQAKIPANCFFLNSKRFNSSVWTVIQITHAASVSLILKAASEITNLLLKSTSSKDDLMIPLTMLKDSLSLAGIIKKPVLGTLINVSSKLQPIQNFQYPLKQSETTFIEKELESLLQKKVIAIS